MSSVRPEELINAARFSDIETVRSLIARGADVNEKDALGNTALIYVARRYDRLDLAKLLLDKGARINEAGRDGNTPLLLAVRDNNAKMVRFLLDYGAAVDIRNTAGYTAQSLAEQWGYTDIARMIKQTVETRQRIAAEKARRDAEKARAEAAHTLAAQRQERLKKMGGGFRPK